MKIGLVTIHYANSYGGTLQALASQEILSKYGSTRIIDYRNPELNKTLLTIRVGCRPRDLLRMSKDIARLLPRARLIKKFNTFISKRYKLTHNCRTAEELKSVSQEFDAIVCGSDQIWNPDIVGGFDKNYFLGFSSVVNKIAFSSSAGSYEYTKEEQRHVKNLLCGFKSIAVREIDTARKIKEITGRDDIKNTIDPTLLLSKEEWLKLLELDELENTEKYILTYTLKKDKFTRDTIKKASEALGLKVIAIDQDPYLGYPADQHIMDASPVDYVKLFSNASFVITNSFHGTAFSVNFKVPFITVKPESGTNRISGFLDAVGLSERLIQTEEQLAAAIKSMPDFERAHSCLGSLRENSLQYIKGALSL